MRGKGKTELLLLPPQPRLPSAMPACWCGGQRRIFHSAEGLPGFLPPMEGTDDAPQPGITGSGLIGNVSVCHPELEAKADWFRK
ncbi:MAG: hypothetical protein NZ602_10500 [Thermoguttaceae bacterium]|nr:hypothetical protein [Thermoguttaceae bacterium]MDW8038066.1 hypothetical protein [Thermoguttaceae bacterium]